MSEDYGNNEACVIGVVAGYLTAADEAFQKGQPAKAQAYMSEARAVIKKQSADAQYDYEWAWSKYNPENQSVYDMDAADALAWAKEAGFLNDDGTVTPLGETMPGAQS